MIEERLAATEGHLRMQDRRGPHLVAFAGDHDSRRRSGLAFHEGTETAAVVGVANIRPHRPVQRAASLAMEDAGVPVGYRWHTPEIEVEQRAFSHVRPIKARPRKCPVIEEGVIIAIPAAPAFAEGAGGARDEGREARRFWSQRGSEALKVVRLLQILQDADKVLAQALHALCRDGHKGLDIARHDDQLAVLRVPPFHEPD